MAWFLIQHTADNGQVIEFGIRGDATPVDFEQIAAQHGVSIKERIWAPTTNPKHHRVKAFEIREIEELFPKKDKNT